MDGGRIVRVYDDFSDGWTENTATQVTALIMAGASVVAYIIGEGLTDSANVETTVEITENDGKEA